MYSDGLVEGRGASLDEGLASLLDTVERLRDLSLEDLCDTLLAQVTGTAEADVVLLGVRAHCEDRPRPPEADPGHVPGRGVDPEARIAGRGGVNGAAAEAEFVEGQQTRVGTGQHRGTGDPASVGLR